MTNTRLQSRFLMTSALIPFSMLAATPALADCLPNASGTVINCNADDPNGFIAGDGITINVFPLATVDGPLTVGTAGRINNEGTVGNTGDSALTAGGGSTVANTRIGVVNGSLAFGATPNAGQVNTFENRGSFNASVTSAGALTLTNQYEGIEIGEITGDISSTGPTTITNSGAAALIAGNITLGGGGDTITNSGIIAGNIDFGAGTATLSNSATGDISGNLTAMGDTTITNAGAFTGNIMLGAGNDTITNTGLLDGNVDMGAGTNMIGFGSNAALPTGTLTADAAGTNTITLFGDTPQVDILDIAVTNFDVLNKNGTGTWQLTQPVVLADRININAGVLETSDADWLAGNRIVNNATLGFTNLAAGTFAGAIEGTGNVTVGGGGAAVTTFSGANTYTGATTVTTGTLRVIGGAALPDPSVVTITAPAILDVAAAETIGDLQGTGSVTLSGGNLAINSGAFSGVISGANGIEKVGTGILTLSGANTFTGAATVSNGTLALAGGVAIADTTAVVVNAAAGPPATSGILQVNAAETIGSLAGNGGSVALTAGLTTGGDNSSTSYAGVISGAGALTKAGTGTFTVTGANSYSGGTTVNAGILAGAAGPIQGNILVNAAGTLRFEQGVDGTYSGALTGAGTLTKEGGATLTLNGNNNGFTGTTNLNDGAIAIASAANFVAGPVVFDGGTLTTTGAATLANGFTLLAGGGTFNTLADTTVSGVIGGAGALTKAGSANLILTGANGYTGGTTVSAGTLTGNTTSLQGAIVNNAAVVFDMAAAGTYAGNLSGTGTVTKSGAAILTFSGTNSYTGATNINGGTLVSGPTGIGDVSAVTVATGATLQLAADETIGSLAGAGALDTAAFTLTTGGNNGSTSFTGPVTGTGLTKAGTGTFTLGGTGTLTGALTLAGGGLTVASGGAFTALSTAANAGTLTVGGTLTSPVAAASGATVDVLAGGALVGDVTGAAGSTIRTTGTGAITGNVTSAGTLTGTGTLTGAVVSSGALRPGTSPGILTVAGSFAQTATGTYTADITTLGTAGTGYDQLRVTGTPGTAALAGTLAITSTPGLYVAGTTYDVVLADGGITGDFSAITGNVISSFLSFTDTGIVTIAGTQQAYRLTVARATYAAVIGSAGTPNQIATANGFQGMVTGATGDAATVVTAVDNMSVAQAQSFFDQASPEFYGAFATSLQDQANLFYAQIDRRLGDKGDAEGGDDKPISLWINGYAQWGKGDTDDFRFGTDRDLWGIAGGIDYSMGDYVIGVALGYSDADLDYRLGNAEGSSQSWQIAGYGSVTFGQIDVSAKIGYIDGSFDATRSIVAGTIARSTGADFSGSLFSLSADVGYDLSSDSWTIRPFVGIDFLSGKVDSFSEVGASAIDLSVSSIDADSTRLKVGIDIATETGGLQPFGRLAYTHEVGSNDRGITAAFAGAPSSSFTVEGREVSDSAFEIDAGLQYRIGTNGSVFGGYQGRIRSDQSSHGGNVGVRFSF